MARASIGLTPGISASRAADLAVQDGDLVQQQSGELAVVVIEHAVQGLDQLVVLGLHPVARWNCTAVTSAVDLIWPRLKLPTSACEAVTLRIG